MPGASGTIKEIKVSENQGVSKDDEIAVIETVDQFGRTSDEVVKAPISGTVTAIYLGADQPAAAGQTPIMEIIDLGDLYIEAFVPEIDIGEVKKDQKVVSEFSALDDVEVTGKVTFVALAPLELQTLSPLYKAEVSLDEIPEDLRVGMSASLRIIVDEKKDVLIIDSSYIFSDDGTSYAHRVVIDAETKRDKIEKVEVGLGFEGEVEIEILSGLQLNDRVSLPLSEIETESGFGIFGPGGN